MFPNSLCSLRNWHRREGCQKTLCIIFAQLTASTYKNTYQIIIICFWHIQQRAVTCTFSAQHSSIVHLLWYFTSSWMLKHPTQGSLHEPYYVWWASTVNTFKLDSGRIQWDWHTEWAALSWMNFIMSFLGKSSLLSCSSLHSRVGSAAILERRTRELSPLWRIIQTVKTVLLRRWRIYFIFH